MSSQSSGSAGDSAAAGRLRARDIDRVNARTLLDAAYEEGELGTEEYHQRSERAQRAQTLGELQRLIGDLQPSTKTGDLTPTARPRVRRHASGYPPGTRARDSDRQAACTLLDAGLADGQLSTEDHRTLTELAGGARTLGELSHLTDDLQRPAGARPDPVPPTSRRETWFTAGVVAASILVAVGTFLAVDRPASEPAGPPKVDLGIVKELVLPHPELTQADGLAYFRELYRTKFGDTVVDEAVIYPGYAVVTRAVQPNRKVRYNYRGGFDLGDQPQTRTPQTPTADLAALNVQAIAALLTQAPTLTKVDQGTVSHLGIEGSGTGPIVRIYVGNKAGENGYLEATLDGRITRTQAFGG
ncbi:DUF1707 SHOCT-like domain-containing protein [Nocardia seriolae]|uniref:DUF1707 domain-containing protein n=1 Tax=Nocardia seriolae TaxID=37332 RepID=A0ABC9YYZ4_9NOCA|nr:DUF1707 domain-containing protein [Nocardia seriolae]APA95177.1 uncharacterized protein NS506_01104 [Nocardia seriolae]QOW31938.1 DUF1707 domain-containing protein [Nocardia seriolae]QUN19545.1 DUF1707 domain-containing protein [Nocardia seriolae]WKY52923.1 DUF1707 domain-containing protein [Nocardia seriolae]WNJ59006.1 DUF1707 domain-containing protein [Nocardia seriolae]